MNNVSIITTINKINHFTESYVKSILMQRGAFELTIIIVSDTLDVNEGERITGFVQSLLINLHWKVLLFQNFKPDRGRALNIGIEKSVDKFIAIHDLDDYWHPDKLSIQLSMFDVFSSVDLLATESTVLRRAVPFDLLGHNFPDDNPSTARVDLLLHSNFYFQNPIAHSSIIFRKSSNARYRIGLGSQYDYSFYCDLLACGSCLAVVRSKMTLISHHSSNSFMKNSRLQYKFSFLSKTAVFFFNTFILFYLKSLRLSG